MDFIRNTDLNGGNEMTNFEKFKQDMIQDLIIESLANMIDELYYEDACNYCKYDRYTCAHECKYGIKKSMESEVE